MAPTVSVDAHPVHPQKISAVDQQRAADDLRHRLLALRSKDPRARQIQKDLYKGKNRAPETITTLIASAFNEDKPLDDVLSPSQLLTEFVMTRVRRARRKLRDWSSYSPIETREEGDVNCVQNAIDLGDRSRPTLLRYLKESGEYIDVVQEMREVVMDEVYGPKEGSA
jgi:hypothetical protein